MTRLIGIQQLSYGEWLACPHPKCTGPEEYLTRLDPTESEDGDSPVAQLPAFQQSKLDWRKRKRADYRGLRNEAFLAGNEFLKKHISSHNAAAFCEVDYRRIGVEFAEGREIAARDATEEGKAIIFPNGVVNRWVVSPPRKRRSRSVSRREAPRAGKRCAGNCCDTSEDGLRKNRPRI